MWRKKIRANREKWILIFQWEWERDAQSLPPFDATSQSCVFALNSVKPIALTCEQKQMAKTKLKAGVLFSEATPRAVDDFTEIQLNLTGVLRGQSWGPGLGFTHRCPQGPGQVFPSSGPQRLQAGKCRRWWKLISKVSCTSEELWFCILTGFSVCPH